MMPDVLVIGEVRKAIEAWRNVAKDRRAVTTIDPVADTFAYCANDLEKRIERAERAKPTYTTKEYAGLYKVRDGTVRKWIDAGELEAHKNGAGDWEIPRSARRVRTAGSRRDPDVSV